MRRTAQRGVLAQGSARRRGGSGRRSKGECGGLSSVTGDGPRMPVVHFLILLVPPVRGVRLFGSGTLARPPFGGQTSQDNVRLTAAFSARHRRDRPHPHTDLDGLDRPKTAEPARSGRRPAPVSQPTGRGAAVQAAKPSPVGGAWRGPRRGPGRRPRRDQPRSADPWGTGRSARASRGRTPSVS